MNCPSCGHENIDGVDRCENCLAPFRQLDIPSIEASESFAQSVMEDNLGRLEYEPPIYVEPNTPAIDVARRMKRANTGCALVIEDGKLTAPLKGVNLIGNGPETLREVSLLGNDVALSDGSWTCGKDGQSVPVGVGCPTIKIPRITVGDMRRR